MKKIFGFLQVVILLLICSCSKKEETYTFDPVQPTGESLLEWKLKGDSLRILDIGNSYSNDCTNLLPGIVRAAGISVDKVCYYTLGRSSASFATWLNCYNGSDNASYSCNRTLGGIDMKVPTGKFDAYDAIPFKEILSKKWDVIILHQVSNHSNSYMKWNGHSEAGNMYPFVTLLRDLQPQAAFAFYLVHSYESSYSANSEHSSYLRWHNIVNTVQEMQRDYPIFQLIIPYGTAIQSLRTSKYSVTGSELTRDGTHLGFGLARYAAACTLYQSLFYPRYGVSVVGNSYRYSCTESEISSAKYPDGCIDVTDETAEAAQTAANRACLYPYEVFSFNQNK